jgi:hypothetical protein
MSLPYQREKDQYTAEFQQFARENGIEDRGGHHNGVYDAYRHAYVSGRFTQEHGAAVARIVGDGHEYTNRNSKEEHAMDYHNNEVGRHYGSKTRGGAELFNQLMLNEDRMILNVGGQPSNTTYRSSLESPQLASNTPEDLQRTAINNLTAQGMKVDERTNGPGHIVSGTGQFPNREVVADITQYADPNKAKEFAQTISPPTQTVPDRDQPARTMSA